MTAALRITAAVHAGAAAAAALGAWPWAAAAVLANHAALTGCVLWPRNGLIGANMTRLPGAGEGGVALTFDDGPDPRTTPAVLDLLDLHGATASFFCIGKGAARHPALTREIIRRGHYVENHTQRHPNAFAAFSPGQTRRELARAQDVLADLTGRAPRYFRAPMGFRSPFLAPILDELGLRCVSWTRRGLDRVSRDPARISRRLTQRLGAGDILLLHDPAPVAATVLPILLTAIKAHGLAARRLPEPG